MWLQSVLVEQEQVKVHWCEGLIGRWEGHASQAGELNQ